MVDVNLRKRKLIVFLPEEVIKIVKKETGLSRFVEKIFLDIYLRSGGDPEEMRKIVWELFSSSFSKEKGKEERSKEEEVKEVKKEVKEETKRELIDNEVEDWKEEWE